MDANKYKYELLVTTSDLTESQKETLWEELRLNKKIYIEKLEEMKELSDSIAIEWKGNQAIYDSFNLRLKGKIIEVTKKTKTS